jgi:hypothetical protein
MKKYAKHLPDNKPALNKPDVMGELELPVDPGFVSMPAKIDARAMLRRIKQNMPWRSTRPNERERRLASKIDVEFVL